MQRDQTEYIVQQPTQVQTNGTNYTRPTNTQMEYPNMSSK